MRRLRALAALLLFAAAHAAGAQGQDPRLDRLDRLDAPTRRAVALLIDSARLAGLPVEPLVQRALQGAARGASGERIVLAVRRLEGELSVARGALGPRHSDAELVAGAGAVRAGAGQAQLEALRAARPETPLTVPLATLADLVADGVPVGRAVEAVTDALRRGASDEQLVAMRRDVAGDIRGGASPADAAAVRARGIAAQGGGRGVGTVPRQTGRDAARAAGGNGQGLGRKPETPPGRGGRP